MVECFETMCCFGRLLQVHGGAISRRMLGDDQIVLLDHCKETRFSLCFSATPHAAALFVLGGATLFVAAVSFAFESWVTGFRLRAEFDLVGWFRYVESGAHLPVSGARQPRATCVCVCVCVCVCWPSRQCPSILTENSIV